MLSASVVSIFILALLLLNPFSLAQGTTSRLANAVTTETITITTPITTIITPTATITTFTTETQLKSTPTTYTTTITTLTAKTEKTTITSTMTTTETSTTTTPTATIITLTTETQTETTPTIHTTTITTLITTTKRTTLTTLFTTMTETTTVTSTSAPQATTLIVRCTRVAPVIGITDKCGATVFGYSSVPTGNVTWSDNSSGTFSPKTFCSPKPLVSIPLASTCSVKFTPTATGNVTLTANYTPSPGTGYAPSVGTDILNATMKMPSTRVSCTPSSAAAGSTTLITCTATVTGFSPTGTVNWYQGGTGSVSLHYATPCTLISVSSTKGLCSVTMTGSTKGTVTITAIYLGDSNNVQDTFGTATLTINKAT